MFRMKSVRGNVSITLDVTITSNIVAWKNEHVHNEAGMARQGKLKCYDVSEANAMVENTSVNASLLSLHDKPYHTHP